MHKAEMLLSLPQCSVLTVQNSVVHERFAVTSGHELYGHVIIKITCDVTQSGIHMCWCCHSHVHITDTWLY